MKTGLLEVTVPIWRPSPTDKPLSAGARVGEIYIEYHETWRRTATGLPSAIPLPAGRNLRGYNTSLVDRTDMGRRFEYVDTVTSELCDDDPVVREDTKPQRYSSPHRWWFQSKRFGLVVLDHTQLIYHRLRAVCGEGGCRQIPLFDVSGSRRVCGDHVTAVGGTPQTVVRHGLYGADGLFSG